MKKINARHYTLMGLLFLAVAANFNWNLSLKKENTGSSIMASKSQEQISEELENKIVKMGIVYLNQNLVKEMENKLLKFKIEKQEVDLLKEFDELTEAGIFDIGSKKAELISLCEEEWEATAKTT